MLYANTPFYISDLSILGIWHPRGVLELIPQGYRRMTKFYLFIYLFLAALGLRYYAWAFSSCGERGLLFVVVRGLFLIAVASLVAEHGL